MHRDHHVITMREAAAWSGVWVAIGLSFGGLLWWQYGADIGLQYVTGYVIEKSLAVDNVVVWALILAAFAVPRHRSEEHTSEPSHIPLSRMPSSA